MFHYPITTSYTLKDATGEIFIMLLIASILGFILGFLYRKIFYTKNVYMCDVCSNQPQKLQHTSQERVHSEQKDVAQSVAYKESILQPVIIDEESKDDLQKIEGVGPKMEEMLRFHGITSFKILAEKNVMEIKEILDSYGDRYKIINPETWPEQASLARDNKWNELDEYQKFLITGRNPGSFN